MNYILNNLGYDKPVNFRYIVLDAYKNQCIWLRDTYLDRLNLYNYKDWLPDIKYEEKQLKREKEWLKEKEDKLKTYETTDAIEQLYQKELEKVTTYHQCENSWYKDQAELIKTRLEEYNKPLQKWLNINKTFAGLNDVLCDIYNTANDDMKECEQKNIESVASMHLAKEPDFEKFKEDMFNSVGRDIEISKDRIKSIKGCIKRMKVKAEEIKQIFEYLDEIDGGKNYD